MSLRNQPLSKKGPLFDNSGPWEKKDLEATSLYFLKKRPYK
jgi:hypothetical protein